MKVLVFLQSIIIEKFTLSTSEFYFGCPHPNFGKLLRAASAFIMKLYSSFKKKLLKW